MEVHISLNLLNIFSFSILKISRLHLNFNLLNYGQDKINLLNLFSCKIRNCNLFKMYNSNMCCLIQDKQICHQFIYSMSLLHSDWGLCSSALDGLTHISQVWSRGQTKNFPVIKHFSNYPLR